jgi:hypothetical protein
MLFFLFEIKMVLGYLGIKKINYNKNIKRMLV